mmetsp:Transcript_11737/g.29671  ORF Transcript_11737/g.29671 Transcript_11737/m.29671 type:complete len:431 (-) Transcript_11737:2122-3414(-)
MSAGAPSPFEAILKERASRNLLRRTAPAQSSQIDFSSNDYIGLARSLQLHAAHIARLHTSLSSASPSNAAGLLRRLNGATGSRLISGNYDLLERCENQLGSFFKSGGVPALVFSSGFEANAGLIGCLAREGDGILYDEEVHASIHDGLSLSRCQTLEKFLHNDVDAFEQKLLDLHHTLSNPTGSIFVVIESLYSMSGSICPMTRLFRAIEKHRDVLSRYVGVVVDEAHAGGVLGQQGGAGLTCARGLENHPRLLARVLTFGKGFGASGAAIVTSSTPFREYLINYARPLVFSTAPSPSALTLISCAVELGGDNRRANLARAKLHVLSEYFTTVAPARLAHLPGCAGILGAVVSPVKAVVIPGEKACLAVAEAVRTQGFEVVAIRSPSVAKGTERVRVVVHAFNTRDEIDRLIESFEVGLKSQAGMLGAKL